MTKISLFVLSLLIGFTILSSCNKPHNSKTNAEKESKKKFDLTIAKKEIEEANRNFMDLFAKGDSVELANSYTIDAKLMNAGAPSVVGRANIQTARSNIIKSGITGVDLRTKNIYGTEDLIVEEGELSIFVGDVSVAEEKYIVVWEKEDGRWKLFIDIFNSNLQAK